MNASIVASNRGWQHLENFTYIGIVQWKNIQTLQIAGADAWNKG